MPTEVEILRPTNAASGNRRLFYEVLNRGNKPGFPLFNDVPVSINDLVKASDAGNGFMMNRGYTLVWSGWQGDVASGRRPHDLLAAGRARHHRARARRFHLRSHATIPPAQR